MSTSEPAISDTSTFIWKVTETDDSKNGGELQLQMVKHSNEIENPADEKSKYVCDLCRKSYRHEWQLERHYSQFHSSTDFDGKPYECNVCGKRFETRICLDEHMLLHPNERPYECPKCEKSYTSKFALKLHMDIIHTVTSSHKCLECDATFKCELYLKNHVRGVHLKKGYAVSSARRQSQQHKCTVCGAVVNSIATHMLLHQDKMYECDICKKTFTYRVNLKSHMLIHQNVKQHKCPICDMQFRHKGYLKTHMQYHSKKIFTCNICDMRVKNERTFKRHMAQHANRNVKLHKCSECDASFEYPSFLKRHMVTHSDDTPYKCDICGRSFAQKGARNQHTSMVHADVLSHKCHLCSKAYCREDHLQSHLRVHSGELKYECKDCGVGFAHVYQLDIHMTSHTGVKPYTCRVCGSGFIMVGALDRHMKTHKDVVAQAADGADASDTESTTLLSDVKSTNVVALPFFCIECNAECSSEVQLQDHAILHTTVKSFKCVLCNVGFKSVKHLKDHSMEHSGYKCHKCEICNHKFSLKINLRQHIYEHSREKQFKCEVCNTKFVYETSVGGHRCGYFKVAQQDNNSPHLKEQGPNTPSLETKQQNPHCLRQDSSKESHCLKPEVPKETHCLKSRFAEEPDCIKEPHCFKSNVTTTVCPTPTVQDGLCSGYGSPTPDTKLSHNKFLDVRSRDMYPEHIDSRIKSEPNVNYVEHPCDLPIKSEPNVANTCDSLVSIRMFDAAYNTTDGAKQAQKSIIPIYSELERERKQSNVYDNLSDAKEHVVDINSSIPATTQPANFISSVNEHIYIICHCWVNVLNLKLYSMTMQSIILTAGKCLSEINICMLLIHNILIFPCIRITRSSNGRKTRITTL